MRKSAWRRLIGLVALAAASGCSGSSDPSAQALAGTASQVSVLQYHKNATRDGIYVDPALTQATAAAMTPVSQFNASLNGPVYAQPLYLQNAVNGQDALYVVTEQNDVVAMDASTGATLWQKNLGTPVPSSQLPCGNIDPLGITGTPAIDPGSGTIYLDAVITPDGTAVQHKIFALSTSDGSTRSGWPVDVSSALAARGMTFNAQYQNQRGALALFNGVVYVPYGGHDGDCGDYNGWVVGVSASNPSSVAAWKTSAAKGGAWAPGGIASDGSYLYVGTGNTEGATQWSGGDAVIRLSPGPSFGGGPNDFFAPSNWQALDANDTDLGSGGPVVFDLPGQSPNNFLVEMGKSGIAYLLNRNQLGGVSAPISQFQAAGGVIISAPVVYTPPSGTYIAFWAASPNCPSGSSGADFMAVKLGSNNQMTTAWCATEGGHGSPILTTSDGSHDPVVWVAGAEGDNVLHAFNGETGAPIYSSDPLPNIRRFETPIEARGRIYVPTDTGLYAFQAQ